MITLRKADDRGHAQHGWLDSHHSFSFASYYDPAHLGFRHLRVINEDRIAPGAGFPTHPHRDMEIISYIVSGSLAHQDSLGNVETIGANGVQRFSAGTGIAHSEFNPSSTEPAHFLQIWILPQANGLTPSYEQQVFTPASKQGQWQPIAAPHPENGAVKIHQDVQLLATVLQPGEQRRYELGSDRHAWVQVVTGNIRLNELPLVAGDGAAISTEKHLMIEASTEAEVLLFDLA